MFSSRPLVALSLALALALAACLAFAAPSRAFDLPWLPPSSVEMSFLDPQVLRHGDLDGDGGLDLIAAGGGGLSWWRWSLGTWTETVIDAAFTQGVDLELADLDADGDLDVVVAAATGLSFYRNSLGDGSTWAQVSIQAAVPARGLDLGDLDADGKLDVSAALGGTFEWWRNSAGDGSAWTRILIATQASAADVAVVDLDRNGALDVVGSADGSADLVTYLRNLDRLGTSWSRLDMAIGLDGAQALEVGDFDGEGSPDVVVGLASAGEVLALFNDGSPNDGGFLVVELADVPGPQMLDAADIDRDGDSDLVVAAPAAAGFLENLAPRQAMPLRPIGVGGLKAATAADFDRDGDLDLGAAESVLGQILHFTNDSSHRNALFPTLFDLEASFNGVRAVLPADLDGDGDLDLIAASPLTNTVKWYENLPAGFAARTIDAAFTGAFGVDAGDLDNDGDLDVLAVGDSNNQVAWWRNDGNGTFTRLSVATLAIAGARAVATGDLDNDGDLDVAAALTIDDVVSVWRNNGTATAFARVDLDLAFDRAHSVAIADIDGDGDLDVTAVGQVEDRVAWWANDGTATSWTKHIVNLVAIDSPWLVHPADVDADGDIDLLAAFSVADKISFFENLGGDGLTWNEISLGFFNEAEGIATADFDGDGFLDVAGAAFKDGGRVAWWRNTLGDGSSWTRTNIDLAFDGAAAIVAADFEADGLAGLVACAETADRVALWQNSGGQYRLFGQNISPVSLLPGTREGIFKLTLTPNGRSLEADVELARLEVQLEEAAGDPLDTFEANATIERLEVLRDNHLGGVIGSPDPTDTSIANVEALSLDSAGNQAIVIPDGAAAAAVAQGSSAVFFVMAETKASFAGVAVRDLRFGLLIDRARAEDRDFDVELRGESQANIFTPFFHINDLANLALTVDDSPEVVIAGNQISYSATITNLGPDPALTPTLNVTLPSGTTLVSSVGCAQDPGGAPLCTLANLAVMQQALVTLTVAVPVQAAGELVFQANVSSTTVDPLSANNAAAETTTVVALSDLAIEIRGRADYADNDVLTFEVWVRNLGPGPAMGASVAVDLPSILSGAVWTCLPEVGATCPPNGSGDISTVVDLAAGAGASFRVEGFVPEGTTTPLSLAATIATGPSSTDSVAINNSAKRTLVWGNPIFFDGFESGSTAAWSITTP